jgi:hypothetical protein
MLGLVYCSVNNPILSNIQPYCYIYCTANKQLLAHYAAGISLLPAQSALYLPRARDSERREPRHSAILLRVGDDEAHAP